MAKKQSLQIGGLRTNIGLSKKGNHQLRSLAFIKKCDPSKCKISSICEQANDGKCAVEETFLLGIYSDWTDEKNGIGDQLNQIQLDRIGSHLMPLYMQLVRFSMEILGLDGTSYENKAGIKSEYPQYKGQRDVLKHINQELKDLGLEKIWAAKFSATKDLPTGKNSTLDLGKIARKGQVGVYERKFGLDKDE